MVKLAIIGGSGYTASELLRILFNHPRVEIQQVTSRQYAGQSLNAVFPNLSATDLEFTHPSQLQDCDCVFFATPSGVAMKQIEPLIAKGQRVIDLSPDFRVDNISLWERWYGMPHACPQLVKQAVYGLSEMHRERIRSAQLLANPGCYATTIQLALLPLLQPACAAAVDLSNIIVDAKSGVSGAGKVLREANLYSNVANSFQAYSTAGHRHSAEIIENLRSQQADCSLVLVPHLVPMVRGIFASIYVPIIRQQNWQQLFDEFYRNERFVKVVPDANKLCSKQVYASNSCHIALQEQGDKLLIFAVTDNLGKGAAGQAVQNMNLMFGWDEGTALSTSGIYP